MLYFSCLEYPIGLLGSHHATDSRLFILLFLPFQMDAFLANKCAKSNLTFVKMLCFLLKIIRAVLCLLYFAPIVLKKFRALSYRCLLSCTTTSVPIQRLFFRKVLTYDCLHTQLVPLFPMIYRLVLVLRTANRHESTSTTT